MVSQSKGSPEEVIHVGICYLDLSTRRPRRFLLKRLTMFAGKVRAEQILCAILQGVAGEQGNLGPSIGCEGRSRCDRSPVKDLAVIGHGLVGVTEQRLHLAKLKFQQRLGRPPLTLLKLTLDCQKCGRGLRRNARPHDVGDTRSWCFHSCLAVRIDQGGPRLSF